MQLQCKCKCLCWPNKYTGDWQVLTGTQIHNPCPYQTKTTLLCLILWLYQVALLSLVCYIFHCRPSSFVLFYPVPSGCIYAWGMGLYFFIARVYRFYYTLILLYITNYGDPRNRTFTSHSRHFLWLAAAAFSTALAGALTCLSGCKYENGGLSSKISSARTRINALSPSFEPPRLLS